MPTAIKSVLLLLLLAGAGGKAATFTVAMTPRLTFDPNLLEIGLGDTVIWTNEDIVNPHDTTSTEGYWASPLLDYGQTYSLTFPVTGAFPYEDSFYGPAGMTGIIVVVPTLTVPLLASPSSMPGGGFQFMVTNLVAGQTNIIQVSTNLVDWTAIQTNVAAGSGYIFMDGAAVIYRQRFYRALVPP